MNTVKKWSDIIARKERKMLDEAVDRVKVKRVKIPTKCPNCGTKINQKANEANVQAWNDKPGIRDYDRIYTINVIGCKKCNWSPGQ